MTRKVLLNVAISIFVLSAPVFASAQNNASDIRPHFGYYYWDFVAFEGLESYQVATPTSTRTIGGIGAGNQVIPRRPVIGINGARLEYVYDFCGKSNNLIGFIAEKNRRTSDPLTGDAIDDNANETDLLTVFFGQHFSAGDFADFYTRVGLIHAEGYFVETFGEEYEQRAMLELGFRSRVGDRRNIELIQKTRYDDLYRLQFETGFLYHSAAGFSFGFSYEIRDKAEYRELGTIPAEEFIPRIENQDRVSVTLRLNI